MSTEQSGGGRGGGGNGGNGGNGNGTDVTARIGDPVTDDYLVGLRVALIGLPHTEVAEIVDDARGHLAELAEELGAGYGRDAVHARLGSPQDYAAELRAAAGYPPAQQGPVERPRTGQAGFALAALVVATAAAGAAGLAVGQVGPSTVAPLFLAVPLAAAGALAAWSDGPGQPAAASLPSVVALRERLARARTDGAAGGFVLSLQPGWWVLRALVAAGVIGWVFGGGGSAGLVTALVLAVPAVPLSVLLGRRSAADRRLLWAVVPLNAFAVGLLVAAVLAQGQDRTGDVVSYSPPAGLSLDGTTVADVRPFDAKGRPLSEVYLFDENGRPLAVDDHSCVDEGVDEGYVATSTPPAPGPYPRGVRTTDPTTGRCVTQPPQPLVVTIPQTTAPRPTSAPPAPSPAQSTAPVPAAPTTTG